MKLKILCSGHLVRYPLGGHCWHHLQYLVGLKRLGHEVAYFEDWGWPDSCYDAGRDQMTADPTYGLSFLRELLHPHELDDRWCYLAEDGRSLGMSRARLSQCCRECDLYLNLSNMNWIDELEQCRLRVMIDTDPVFTQIGAHGMGGTFDRYHLLFTYGENVHREGCSMPTGQARWLPTRQPIVLELWPVHSGDSSAPWSSVMNWSAYGDHAHEGRTFGQKDREFEPFWDLPRRSGQEMMLAIAAPAQITQRLHAGGWRIADPLAVTRKPACYQAFLRQSAGEWCVAKHGYVATQCGWFSDRSAAYLASGRPVVLQETGFSRNLPCGNGLLTYRSSQEAIDALRRVRTDYAAHSRGAHRVAQECFDSGLVLQALLEACATEGARC